MDVSGHRLMIRRCVDCRRPSPSNSAPRMGLGSAGPAGMFNRRLTFARTEPGRGLDPTAGMLMRAHCCLGSAAHPLDASV